MKKVDSSFVIKPFSQAKKEKKVDDFRLIDMMDLGIYFVVPLLMGVGVGIVVDTKFGTRPIGVICGLLLGVAGSFFNLIKIVRQFSKHA